MSTKEELKKTFSVFVDKENNIISIIFSKEPRGINDNIAQTELVEERLMEILEENSNKKFNVLLDIVDLGEKGGDISPREIREAYTRMAALKQVKKIGIILSGNPILEVMANLIVKSVAKQEAFKFFRSRQEAMVWIKSKN